MLKRLDWLDVHGQNGGDSSSGGSSSPDTESEADSEESAELNAPQALSKAGAPRSRLVQPAVKKPQAAAMAAAAAAVNVEHTTNKSKRQKPDKNNVTQVKKQSNPAANGTANVAQPAPRSESEDWGTATKPPKKKNSSGGEQQNQQQPKQQQEKQLQQFSRAHMRQLEASSGSDTDGDDSDDEDMAEYTREVMLGRHISSSDDEPGAGDEGDAAAGSEGGEQAPELQVGEVERNWLEAEVPEAVRGVALRCVPCRALLLNAQSYRSHVTSKKHLSAMKHWVSDEQGHFIAFATDAPGEKSGDAEGETHAERLQRLKAQVAAENGGLLGLAEQQSKNKRKQMKRKRKAGAVVDEAQESTKRSKKGRRQRAAAKAAAVSALDVKGDKHHNPAAQRRKERRAIAAAAAAAAAAGAQA